MAYSFPNIEKSHIGLNIFTLGEGFGEKYRVASR
jgi:hypothetical protein